MDHLHPVHVGQSQVQQHHVRRVLFGHPQRGGPGARGVHLIATRPQVHGQRLDDLRLVVHQQYPHPAILPEPAPAVVGLGMPNSSRAGQPAGPDDLVDVAALIAAYYDRQPDVSQPEQRVSFGTSGHRGSSLASTFNENHILATSQAICEYRAAQGIDGPLYLGADSHALSEPATRSALEVFAANQVSVLIDSRGGYTPTPAVSRAILDHNAGRPAHRADGVVVTPSHNPPGDGGFKYNPPDGGPAGTEITGWIQNRANELLAGGLAELRRTGYQQPPDSEYVSGFDFLDHYVSALEKVLDLAAIAAAGVRIGADPLGGASVAYWAEIGSRYNLDLTVVNPAVDPQFGFMTLDWDGKIRMDCSSPSAMASLISRQHDFDIATGNDTDADRHGIVTPDAGLMNPNHYLAVAIGYLYAHRTGWRPDAAVGKTLVSSSMIDRVAADLGRQADRGAGRVQVVRARPAGRLGGFRRRGVGRRVVPAARRLGLDHRQGRHHRLPAGLGDPGGDRRISQRALPQADRTVR